MTINKSRNQIGILGVHLCYFALSIFVSVFLVAKLYTVTNSNLASIAFFHIVWHTAVFVTFYLSSYITKKHSRIWTLRLSSLLLVVAVTFITLFTNNLNNTYILLAFIWGLADGVFWSAIHTLTSQTLDKTKMGAFTAWFEIINALAKIVFPITLGTIIVYVNFSTAAIISLTIGILLVACTLVLRDEKSNNESMSMRTYFAFVKKQKSERIVALANLAHFLNGFFGTLSIFITILIMIVYNSDFNLGMFSSVFSLASIVVIVFYKSLKNTRLKNWFYWFTGFAPFCASIGFLIGINPLTLIVFQASYSSLSCIIKMELTYIRMNLMKDIGATKFTAEHMVHNEFYYFIARIIAMSVVALAYYLDMFDLFKIMVMFLSLTLLICTVIVKVWHKKYSVRNI